MSKIVKKTYWLYCLLLLKRNPMITNSSQKFCKEKKKKSWQTGGIFSWGFFWVVYTQLNFICLKNIECYKQML